MKAEQFVDCNSKTLEMFGCSRDEIIGTTPSKFSPEKQPDGRNSKEKSFNFINRALSGEAVYFCRMQFIKFRKQQTKQKI